MAQDRLLLIPKFELVLSSNKNTSPNFGFRPLLDRAVFGTRRRRLAGKTVGSSHPKWSPRRLDLSFAPTPTLRTKQVRPTRDFMQGHSLGRGMGPGEETWFKTPLRGWFKTLNFQLSAPASLKPLWRELVPISSIAELKMFVTSGMGVQSCLGSLGLGDVGWVLNHEGYQKSGGIGGEASPWRVWKGGLEGTPTDGSMFFEARFAWLKGDKGVGGRSREAQKAKKPDQRIKKQAAKQETAKAKKPRRIGNQEAIKAVNTKTPRSQEA